MANLLNILALIFFKSLEYGLPPQPFFVQINKIKNYLKYEEDGDWEDATGTSLPAALLICDTPTQAEKLTKYADREIDDFDSDESPIMITFKGGVVGAFDA